MDFNDTASFSEDLFANAALSAPKKPALSKSDRVYQHIKDMILHYELKPGQKILEDEMATILDTSRTPVREALRKLSNDGLLTIYPKRYAEVTYFTPEMARQLGVVRMSQDILSGHLAIYYGSDADFAQLQQLANACEVAASSGNLYQRIVADVAFHQKIADISKNEILIKYQQEVYLRVHLIQLQYSTLFNDTEQRVANHSNIIDALSNRDEEAFIRTTCTRCQEMYGLDPKVVSLYLR